LVDYIFNCAIFLVGSLILIIKSPHKAGILSTYYYYWKYIVYKPKQNNFLFYYYCY